MRATRGGGGIYNDGNPGSARASITNSTVSGNSLTGFYGGGIYNSDWLSITNSTFSGNSATFGGGGIYHVNVGFLGSPPSLLSITNSTFSGNSASNGDDIYNDASSGGSADVSIGDTILNGASSQTIYNDSGTVTSQG